MTALRRRLRVGAGAVLASTALLTAALPAGLLPAGATPAHAAVSSRHPQTGAAASPLEVSVVDISPWTPASTMTPRPLSITVSLHNTTGVAVDHVALRLGRGEPVSTVDGLTPSRTDTVLPSNLLTIAPRPASRQTVDVPAGGRVQVTFSTVSGIPDSFPLCLCHNAAYPLYVQAYDSTTGQLDGFVRTYVASIDRQSDSSGNPFTKIGVSWVWPLLDRPHRRSDDRVFTDHGLDREIRPGGRLDRALQVVEDVGPDVPLTVMLDPDLIDELAVMASGNYSYLSGDGGTVRGADGPAAAQWLARLRDALADDPGVTVQFTPYADPAVEALNESALTWRTQVPVDMSRRVEGALGLSTLPSTLSWPPGDAVSSSTLDEIAGHGSTSVLLNSADVVPGTTGSLPTSLAELHTGHGSVIAALVSSTMQAQVAATVSESDPDLSQLPDLLAQLAVRASTPPYTHRVAFLTAPRYVNPSPAAADTVIRETSSSALSQPVSTATALSGAASATLPRARVKQVLRAAQLPASMISTATTVSTSVAAIRSLLTGSSATSTAAALISQLPRGLQRSESGAWLTGSGAPGRSVGPALADGVRRQAATLLDGVEIVRPAGGHYSYTLGSKNSPLPITVENTLPYRAFVRIKVSTAGGLPGLSTSDLGVLSIAPDSKQTFRVPAHVQRSGRIELSAILTTANGRYDLGPRVRLSVHSTVFGAVGVVITVVAAVVLLLALGLRSVRRLRKRRRDKAQVPDSPQTMSSPEPVS